jgi:hypothetical protein
LEVSSAKGGITNHAAKTEPIITRTIAQQETFTACPTRPERLGVLEDISSCIALYRIIFMISDASYPLRSKPAMMFIECFECEKKSVSPLHSQFNPGSPSGV